jgi:hypothetical protein
LIKKEVPIFYLVSNYILPTECSMPFFATASLILVPVDFVVKLGINILDGRYFGIPFLVSLNLIRILSLLCSFKEIFISGKTPFSTDWIPFRIKFVKILPISLEIPLKKAGLTSLTISIIPKMSVLVLFYVDNILSLKVFP